MRSTIALEQILDSEASLRADPQRVLRLDADDVLDLANHVLGVRGGEVDLVDHRHHFEALLDRRVTVRHALRLHALAGVDDQQCAFASRERSRHFVGEVDVPRCVDQIDLIVEPVARAVAQRDALRLDRDAALALEVHGIEHLVLHLARGEPSAELDQSIGERRLAVIYVGDDGEVADPIHGTEAAQATRRRGL